MSYTCVRAVGSAKPCLGRAFPIRCASSHRALTAVCMDGCRTWCEADSFDRDEFFASGRLAWLGWSAWWRWEQLAACFSCRSITAAGLLASILSLTKPVFNEWLNVDARPHPAQGSWIYMSAARPVGLKLNRDRARMWRATA